MLLVLGPWLSVRCSESSGVAMPSFQTFLEVWRLRPLFCAPSQSALGLHCLNQVVAAALT